jgi:hypothetical protein
VLPLDAARASISMPSWFTEIGGAVFSAFRAFLHGSEAFGRSHGQGVYGREVPQSKSHLQKEPGAKDLAVRMLCRMQNAISEK